MCSSDLQQHGQEEGHGQQADAAGGCAERSEEEQAAQRDEDGGDEGHALHPRIAQQVIEEGRKVIQGQVARQEDEQALADVLVPPQQHGDGDGEGDDPPEQGALDFRFIHGARF